MPLSTVFVLDDFGTSVTPPGSPPIAGRLPGQGLTFSHEENALVGSPIFALNSPMKRPNEPMICLGKGLSDCIVRNCHQWCIHSTKISTATQTGDSS